MEVGPRKSWRIKRDRPVSLQDLLPNKGYRLGLEPFSFALGVGWLGHAFLRWSARCPGCTQATPAHGDFNAMMNA